MARAPAEKRLLAAQFQPHRPARLLGEERAQKLVLKQILLGTEAAAHVIDQHPDMMQRQPEDLGKDSAHHECGLGRNPHRELAGPIPLANADIGFHVGRRRTAHLVLAFDDEVGVGETAADVTARDDERVDDKVARVRLMNERRPGAQRFFHRENGRQCLVLDFDEVERLFRDLLADGSDRGDAIAPVADFVIEDVLVLGHRRGARMGRSVVEDARHVVVREHRLHAGKRKRLRRIDAPDPRVSDGAALDLGVQHARQRDVAGIPRLAGHLAQGVDALDAVTDDREVHRTLSLASGGVFAPADSSRAVARIASMILV